MSDVVLITSFVALLLIGILASTGVFQFIGTTNASYLSYGMYTGAALFLIAELIKKLANLSPLKERDLGNVGSISQIALQKNDS